MASDAYSLVGIGLLYDFKLQVEAVEANFWVAELSFGTGNRSDLLDGVSRDDRGLSRRELIQVLVG